MLKVLFFVLCLHIAHSRHFNNPVVNNADTPDPGVVKYNGLYYAVTTSNNDSPNKFPFRVSTDLQNWNLTSFYVFDETNKPVWSTNVEYWAPEIHILGEGQFRVYFTTRDKESGRLAIGAAYSTVITGPYHALDRPLVLDYSQDVLDATLIDTGLSLYLVWKGSEWMYGHLMENDGLTFSVREPTIEVMRNDLEWESYIIEGPFFIRRDNLFYMFYSGNEYCGTKYAVGVARSEMPLGPYEKRGDPILVTDKVLAGPGHCSVVKDVDEVNDVMIFHAYKAGEVCQQYPRLMSVRSIAWGDDGWPYMKD